MFTDELDTIVAVHFRSGPHMTAGERDFAQLRSTN